MRNTALVTLLAAASACVPAHGPMMDPFADCLGCHSSTGGAKTWTVAGTWRKGAQVTVTDASGRIVTMRGNDAGNFYTAEPLALPYTVSVDGKTMPDWKDPTKSTVMQFKDSRLGSCNMCHRAEVVTIGAEMLPGSDCLSCHNPTGVASTSPFTAAGTFPPPGWPAGTPVRVGGQATTTNAVGNFYVTGPISFPATATVAGSSMQGGAPYGGCNVCHANGVAGDSGGG